MPQIGFIGERLDIIVRQESTLGPYLYIAKSGFNWMYNSRLCSKECFGRK